ncbi:LOW QUALITY PROTEIN: GPI transamidase component PIG-T-like [Pecten maximus]|uniref:LOW QUALITY PROTEIN: GPI transamidase component PIG-T-like n=1 Tax=Pecten maximus TaxID=6579 RepID=UPI001458F2E4|nr:LOW QUALITY PROTEIN: GPI transamidase component PIG-T-like [Pecten maximus]
MPGLREKMWLFCLPLLVCIVQAIQNDDFNEELFIKPFGSGHVMFHFQFTTKWNVSIADEKAYTHYRLFPKSLGEVMSTYGVQELHLTQTQGLWRYRHWGYPPEDAPPGAELWTWFQPNKDRSDQAARDKLWSNYVNALSGLFCSSLNFMDSKATVSPRWTFRPQGLASEYYSMNWRNLKYSALPREVVCTENLTPWKKLLPCDSKVGLSTLFNAIKLHDSSYQSIGLHVRPVCRDAACLMSSIELKQTLTVVFDPTTNRLGRQTWSFSSVFGKPLRSQCPLASSSNVYVDVTDKDIPESKFTLRQEPSQVVPINRGGDRRTYAVFDVGDFLEEDGFLDLTAEYEQKAAYRQGPEPSVYAHRFVTGFGLERGGITCQIYNNLDQNLTLIYMETIPWYLRVYYNSLSIRNKGTDIKPFKVHFVPGKDRLRPYHLEVVFRLRANSVTRINLAFDRAFLKWTEYPPDANHGFYANSAVLTTVLPYGHSYTAVQQNASFFQESFSDASNQFFLRVHTESLLISLPTPDFSMPYNVICLACTVVAIAFGSIHNLTTRVFKTIDPKKTKGLKEKRESFFNWRKKGTEENKTDEKRHEENDSDSKSPKESCKSVSHEKQS